MHGSGRRVAWSRDRARPPRSPSTGRPPRCRRPRRRRPSLDPVRQPLPPLRLRPLLLLPPPPPLPPPHAPWMPPPPAPRPAPPSLAPAPPPPAASPPPWPPPASPRARPPPAPPAACRAGPAPPRPRRPPAPRVAPPRESAASSADNPPPAMAARSAASARSAADVAGLGAAAGGGAGAALVGGRLARLVGSGGGAACLVLLLGLFFEGACALACPAVSSASTAPPSPHSRPRHLRRVLCLCRVLYLRPLRCNRGGRLRRRCVLPDEQLGVSLGSQQRLHARLLPCRSGRHQGGAADDELHVDVGRVLQQEEHDGEVWPRSAVCIHERGGADGARHDDPRASLHGRGAAEAGLQVDARAQLQQLPHHISSWPKAAALCSRDSVEARPSLIVVVQRASTCPPLRIHLTTFCSLSRPADSKGQRVARAHGTWDPSRAHLLCSSPMLAQL